MDYAIGWPRVVAVALALTGCGFDSGGDGASTGDTSTGSTDPSATTASTDPATTDPSTVSATTDPATTDPATTDPATTDTDPSTDSSESDPSQGSTGDVDADYAPCPNLECPEGQICAQHPTMPQVTTCRETCNLPDDCPVPDSGSAVILCPQPNYGYCVLGCDPGECPEGQTCFETQFGSSCYWDA